MFVWSRKVVVIRFRCDSQRTGNTGGVYTDNVMEAARTTIDAPELERALRGEQTRGDPESLAQDLEAKAVQLAVRATLDRSRHGVATDLEQLNLGDLLRASSTEENQAGRMKDEEIVRELDAAEAGQPLADPLILAQALHAKAQWLLAQAERQSHGAEPSGSPEATALAA